jgi:hypothetical protein
VLQRYRVPVAQTVDLSLAWRPVADTLVHEVQRTMFATALFVTCSKLHATCQAAHADQAVCAACESVAAQQIPLNDGLVEVKCR